MVGRLASRVIVYPTLVPRMKPWLHFMGSHQQLRELPKYDPNTNLIPISLPGKAASAGSIPKVIPEKSEQVAMATDGEKACESCHVTSASRWYQWGPVHEHCRLCSHCYTYWRKYGGLKLPTKWGRGGGESHFV